MNIDDKIKQELEQEAQQLDAMLAGQPGIFNMLANAYKGALGGWVVVVTLVALVVTGVLCWAGYEFFMTKVDFIGPKLYWGVILTIAIIILIALKMWVFMEMNRQSTVREIKRLELMIERLIIQLEK